MSKPISYFNMQLVKNAAAGLLTSTKKRELITPVLEKRHWLLVKYRIQYKVLLYAFRAVHHMAPEYITALIHMNSGTPQRSFNFLLLSVPKTHSNT